MAYERHQEVEKRWFSFTVLTLISVAIGGLVLVLPPFFMQGVVEPVPGHRPYTALEQEGRDIYVREGCYVCHSQMVRPLATETARYGAYSLAGESVYDRPFQFGSRRTGPDLARVGGKYPDSWHWLHFVDPQSIEPRSNMPSFSFLTETALDLSLTQTKLEALRTLGTPYSDAEVANGVDDAQKQMDGVVGSLRKDGIELDETQARSEAIALIAYLQSLGHALRAAEGGAR
ncbi:MAG: cytochrome-c oxidase, cbb3-type subunit II [Myxococcota bacterium]